MFDSSGPHFFNVDPGSKGKIGTDLICNDMHKMFLYNFILILYYLYTIVHIEM